MADCSGRTAAARVLADSYSAASVQRRRDGRGLDFLEALREPLSNVLTVEGEARNAFKDTILQLANRHQGLMHSVLALSSKHIRPRLALRLQDPPEQPRHEPRVAAAAGRVPPRRGAEALLRGHREGHRQRRPRVPDGAGRAIRADTLPPAADASRREPARRAPAAPPGLPEPHPAVPARGHSLLHLHHRVLRLSRLRRRPLSGTPRP